MTHAVETETAQRLRAVVVRLARALSPTNAGTAADLSPTRVAVLLNTVRNAPVRLAELAEEEGINPTLLSRTVARLSEAGLVERNADSADRRSAWLEPTEAGRALARQIKLERTAAVELALDGLAASDRTNLEAALPALEALAGRLLNV